MHPPAMFFALLMQIALPNLETLPVRDRMKLHENVLRIKYDGVPRITAADRKFLPFSSPLPYYCPLDDTVYAGTGGIDTLDHELAHYYTDKIHESLGLGNFPVSRDCNYMNGRHKAVAEGIATYFQIRLAEYEGTSDRLAISPEYMMYYYAVKPVLDEDVAGGVRYLVRNFPTDSDMTDIDSYSRMAAMRVRKSIRQRGTASLSK